MQQSEHAYSMTLCVNVATYVQMANSTLQHLTICKLIITMSPCGGAEAQPTRPIHHALQ